MNRALLYHESINKKLKRKYLKLPREYPELDPM